MRYWVYTGKDALGPFEVGELRRRVPGFGPDTVVAPEGATGQGAWKPAEAFTDLKEVLQAPPPPLKMPAHLIEQTPRSGGLPPPGKAARSTRTLGALAYESGDFRKAVEHLDKMLEGDVGDADALFYRGMAGLKGLGLGDGIGLWTEILESIAKGEALNSPRPEPVGNIDEPDLSDPNSYRWYIKFKALNSNNSRPGAISPDMTGAEAARLKKRYEKMGFRILEMTKMGLNTTAWTPDIKRWTEILNLIARNAKHG